MDNYILTKEESDRYNILKYISIVFVVYIHSYATYVNFSSGTSELNIPAWLLLFENLVSQVIARCGVPLFFLISSILLFKSTRRYGTTIKNKIKTILVPYFFWNSLWIIVFVFLQNFSFTKYFFSGEKTPILESDFWGWMELYGLGLQLPDPQVYPLWFLRDLFFVTLLFPLIKKIVDKYPRFILGCTIIMLILPIDFPLKQALLWFCLGACIVKLQIHITFVDNISVWKSTCIYSGCAIITLLTGSYIVDVLFIFVGIIYWSRVSKLIFDNVKFKNVFLKLSKWTFIIYAMHELTLTSLKKICMKLLPTEPSWLFAEYVILPVLVIIGCIVFGVFLKKYMPGLYSFVTGSR